MENIDDLVARLAQDAKAVTPAPHPFMLGFKLLAIAVCYLLISLGVVGMRPDWPDKLHSLWFIAEIVTLLLIFLSTTLSAALLAYPDQYQKRRLAMAPMWMLVLFVLVLLFACHADNPASPLPVHSFECTLSITLMSLLPAVWNFYFLRRYASTQVMLAGCVALLSAFSLGALWLRLHEQTDSIAHVITWHYLPMLGIVIIGLWLGKNLLKW